MTVHRISPGNFPTRGRVGMFGLIAAEAAIFTIFVVAYLFYIGKSLTGPMPKDVLRVARLLYGLSAFEQPDHSLRRQSDSRGQNRKFPQLVVRNHGSRRAFLFGTAREWYRLIYKDGLTISTNLFGTTYYSLVGLHAFHVTVGLILLSAVMAFTVLGHVKQEHAYRLDVLSLYWHFVDAVWVVVFTVVYIIGR